MQFDLEIDKLTHSLEDTQTGEILLPEILPLDKTELKDNFRERMIALDEIGFIGNPNHKYSEKDEYLFSAFFQALRKFRKEHQREITTKEIQQLAKDLEYSYNKEFVYA